MNSNKLVKYTHITTITMWLLLLAFIPLALVFVISLLQHNEHQLIIWHFTVANYIKLSNPIYFHIFIHSICIAFICMVLTLLLAYPAAFFLTQISKRLQPILLLLMIIPFWTSSLIRTYAIYTILKAKGLINTLLLTIGITHQPLQLLYTDTAVIIGMVYNLLPYMLLPLYSNIEKLDKSLFDVARDLGATRLRILVDIMLPLTKPGIMAGSLLVFLPAMTLFYISDLLGGAKSLLLGNLIQNQFLVMNDWTGGASTSIALTLLMLALLLFYRRNKPSQHLELL